MKTYTATCDCGWTGGPYRSQAQADYAARRHSCDLWRARTERSTAHAARMAAVDRAPKPCRHQRTTHQHGTHACYVLDRCRCHPCADANAAYEKRRVRQQAYGRWDGLIDAEPVRQHIRALMAAGLGLMQIAARAGLRHGGGTLSKLLYGIPGERPPAARVKPATAARFLAVPIPAPAELAAGARIDGTGAARRLQALACLGWTVQALADRYGIDRQRLDRAVRGVGGITVATHHAVVAMYDDLWDTPAPEDTHRHKLSASRARNRAAAAGWLPPLAWDDDAIDLPEVSQETCETSGIDRIAIEEIIAGRRALTGDAECRTAALILTARGHTARDIADRIGVTKRTVVRWRAA